MLGGLIRKVFQTGAVPSADEAQAIDRVVAATDARLALLPGFRKALLPGVRISRDYVASLVRDWPAPMALSLLSFTLDRRIGLFFSSPASLRAALARSESLLAFFHTPSLGDEAVALLVMQRTDTQRYGLESHNGELRGDVPQVVVSFDHQRVVLPAASWDALRAQAVLRGQDMIAHVIARRLSLLTQERSELESELTRIRLRLASLAHPEALLIDAMPADDPLPHDQAGLLARQAAAQTRLTELRGVTELSGLLELVAHMLTHPQDYFRLEKETLCLDRMGVLRTGQGEDAGTEICMETLHLSAGEPMRQVVLPVRIDRRAMDELMRSTMAE